ncbi:small acid-soluble spore protein Tlp [Ectobacillus ponti]|uniref:Small, acid-soluble spore protein Tlp n=1 Tax=Ectobacillus ponti TaxID=2961894 RepID=A0AA41X5T9_9BACI|nr:small acid-soluble spore protein Tlp [Ectobacillus ponti]MCP8969217.1 small acid-soluble spore protein Tlp [Ectobacillus ponti]
MDQRVNPDNRADNATHLAQHIRNTEENMQQSMETMRNTESPTIKAQIQEKNARREEAIEGMRHELADEQNQ